MADGDLGVVLYEELHRTGAEWQLSEWVCGSGTERLVLAEWMC